MGIVEERSRLESSLDVDAMTFEDVMRLLRSYVKTVLLTDGELNRLSIDSVLQGRFAHLVEAAERRKDPDPAQCENHRVAAWKLQMSLPNASKESLLAEVVVLCTYDRASAEFDTYGPDAMIESILTSVCRLGDDYCAAFVEFASFGEWRQ